MYLDGNDVTSVPAAGEFCGTSARAKDSDDNIWVDLNVNKTGIVQA